jgi:hypothetical protein
MPTAPQPATAHSGTKGRPIVTVFAMLAIVLIIVILGSCIRRNQPPIPESIVLRHSPRPRKRPQKCVARAVLDALPVLSYETALHVHNLDEEKAIEPSVPVQSATTLNNTVLSVGHEKQLERTSLKAGFAPALMQRKEECPICTETFHRTDAVRMLPCDHIYHQRCIDPWLLRFACTCPLWFAIRYFHSCSQLKGTG